MKDVKDQDPNQLNQIEGLVKPSRVREAKTVVCIMGESSKLLDLRNLMTKKKIREACTSLSRDILMVYTFKGCDKGYCLGLSEAFGFDAGVWLEASTGTGILRRGGRRFAQVVCDEMGREFDSHPLREQRENCYYRQKNSKDAYWAHVFKEINAYLAPKLFIVTTSHPKLNNHGENVPIEICIYECRPIEDSMDKAPIDFGPRTSVIYDKKWHATIDKSRVEHSREQSVKAIISKTGNEDFDAGSFTQALDRCLQLLLEKS